MSPSPPLADNRGYGGYGGYGMGGGMGGGMYNRMGMGGMYNRGGTYGYAGYAGNGYGLPGAYSAMDRRFGMGGYGSY